GVSITIKQNDVYKLTLLYRRSRDGGEVAKFRELCNNKGPTIALGKVLDTEEILGGYNPFSWGTEDNINNAVSTNENFIFSFDTNTDMGLVSFVCNSKRAIYDYKYCFPYFGSDLYFGGDSTYTYWWGNYNSSKPYARKRFYQFPIRCSSDRFEWVDW